MNKLQIFARKLLGLPEENPDPVKLKAMAREQMKEIVDTINSSWHADGPSRSAIREFFEQSISNRCDSMLERKYAETMSYINSEAFIDKIVERIKNKQL